MDEEVRIKREMIEVKSVEGLTSEIETVTISDEEDGLLKS